MKIQNLLEGTIKVPSETLKDAMNLVCVDVLSKILTYLRDLEANDDDGDHYGLTDAYKRLHQQYSKLYGVIRLVQKHTDEKTLGTIYIRGDELAGNYIKRTPTAAGKTFPIAMNIEPAEDERSHGSLDAVTHKNKMVANIYVPYGKEIERVARNPEEFNSLMIELHGLVKHELMHSIQHVALGGLTSDKAAQYYNSDRTLNMDKYHSSDIEFSPQIITQVSVYHSFVNKFNLTDEQAKSAARCWVDPNADNTHGFTKILSPFFGHLYKTDKAKWKKAVKYFYGSI
jgi:hypothetical protein